MNTQPLIGITAYEMQHPEPPHSGLYVLGQRYARAIEESGGAPVILPPGLSEDAARQILERLDGLLLSGGGDVDPAIYGAPPHATLSGVSVGRDRLELSLAGWAVEGQKPILAICRGIQVLNVALGGSLIQDISSQVPGALRHHFDGKLIPYDYLAHPVEVEPHSRLASVLGLETVQVNSSHHQAIKHLAADLKVVGRSPDEIVEAVEIPGHPFAIGVQWHPEWLYDKQAEMRRLFAALVEAASSVNQS